MIKCPKCQQRNPSGSKFCNHCGSALLIDCPQCGTHNELDTNTCVECGFILIDPEAGGQQANGDGIKRKKREAERRQLTILFCDLVDSTPLSEKLDPEEFRQVITDYHRLAEKVVKRYGGHVAQYLGDGLLIYFGYPEGLEDAPRAGVRAGLGILQAVSRANQHGESSGKTPVKIRIGIHTGLVVVDDQMALGETVNIAARLEGLAPHNGLVISPQTQRLVQGWFEVKNKGKHTLKGISEPMEVFQVLKESGALTRLDIAKSKGLSPLVGRQQELGLLSGHWEEAKNGNGNLFLINGEAGIGKSRLVDALERQVSGEPDSWVAVARCSAYQQNSAFHPIIELLEKDLLLFDVKDDPEDKLIKLERSLLGSSLDFTTAMPLFAEFLSIPSEQFPPPVLSPFAKRQRIMEGLTEVFLHRTNRQSVLFVIEDLHWADASTLEWLSRFMDQLSSRTIFLLCTTRPGFRPDWQERSGVRQINLQRLSAEEMEDICRHQTNGKALPDKVMVQIADKTEGVPLFVEELTKMILESGMLVEKDDGFEVEGGLSPLAIPSTLQDSLLARLDRLANVKEIVQVGAVLGREFSSDMLNAVLPRKPESMEKSLTRLLEAEIFYRHGPDQPSVYQFKHALIQDAAYESLLKSRRQQLHHRVANVLEHRFTETVQTQPELLAHHYTEAGEPLQAIPAWLKAGRQAGQKNAATEAIAHLEKGIELLPNVKKQADRDQLELDFRLTLGGTFVVAFGFPHPKVKETFDRAREIAQNIEVNPKLALILLNLLSYYFNTEDYKSMQELSDYIRTLTEDPENGYWFELILNQLRDGSMVKGEFEQANQGYQRVIDLFDPSLPFPWELAPSGYIEIGAKAWQMVCLQLLGHMDRAKSLFDQHLSFAADHKDSMTLYHIYTFPALYSLMAREWKTSEKLMEEYLPIVRAFGDPIFTLTAEVYYYIARAFQGDRTAFDTAVNLINVCFDVGFKAFAVSLSHYIGELYFRIGEYDSAISWIKKILDHVNRTGSHINTSELLRIRGLTLQALGEPDSVIEDNFKKALELSRKQSARTYQLRAAVDLARLWQKQGKTKEANDLLKRIYDWFTEGFDSVDLKKAQETLEDLRKG